MKTIQLFNRRANETQEAKLVPAGPEIHARFEDGHFVKFATKDSNDLRAQIEGHNRVNVPHVSQEDLAREHAATQSIIDAL